MRFSVESFRAREVEMHAVRVHILNKRFNHVRDLIRLCTDVDARLLVTRYRTRLCQFIFIVHDHSPHNGFVVLEPEDDATDAL